MYCTVRFLDGYEKLLTYKIPDHLIKSISPGSVVAVPLRTHERYALVTGVTSQARISKDITIRDIIGLAMVPADAVFYRFAQVLVSKYYCSSTHAYERIYSMLKKKQSLDEIVLKLRATAPVDVQLTDEQQAVVDYLTPHVNDSRFEPVLLHGVTGSGKTEVYKKLIRQTIAQGKSVIFLLPEVSLAVQFQALFEKQLEDVPCYSFHSATSVSQKRELWSLLCRENKPLLILGVHLPVFLPMNNLGFIIIDEEHERGFLEKKYPRLNSKELALWRAKLYNIPILLGSATPSLSSLYSVEKLGWKMFKITKRFSGAFPTIRKVLLTERGKRRKNFWLSKELEEAIRQTLARKEQVIMYINRRGHSFFVQCKLCGFIFHCPHCSVSLTYHIKNSTEQLLCHYCDYSTGLVSRCPDCKSDKEFMKKGIGTQQGVSLLESVFPTARIARADLDSTSKKKGWRQTVEAFERGDIDILVGTQTITKGYHFPNVTLVGILWADLNLHFPMYDATEVTLQQLIQVAGRAGRQRPGSQVVVQALQDHYAFDFIDETTYLDFCKQELEVRMLAGYPPVARLACIEMRSADADLIEREIQVLYQELLATVQGQEVDVEIKRPSMPAVYRVNKVEVRHIMLKAKRFADLGRVCDSIQENRYKSEIKRLMHQL